MLHNSKKRFINLSFISIGLTIVGLIAAMICNLGFSRGLLGFCLASVFFVAATICQICFTVSLRLLVDEDSAEHADEIKKANTDMVSGSVKIFFGILLTFAFCLPIAVLTLSHFNSHSGLVIDSWFLFGALFAAVAFLLAYCVYKVFILKALINKEIVWLDEQAVSKAKAESKLLGKICIVFTVVLAIILLATYIITSFVSESTFIDRVRFDDPDKFIAYMQKDYDAWYREGYGDNIDPEFGFPDKQWAEIDGKPYYYCPFLYESIHILQHENGDWEIIVTRNEAYQNGQVTYSILNAGLLSLHVINLAVCVIWYLVKIKNRQTA